MIPLFIKPTNCALRGGKSRKIFSFYFVFRSSSQKYLLKVRGCNIFPCQNISRFTRLFALPTDFHLCLVGKCSAPHNPATDPLPILILICLIGWSFVELSKVVRAVKSWIGHRLTCSWPNQPSEQACRLARCDINGKFYGNCPQLCNFSVVMDSL